MEDSGGRTGDPTGASLIELLERTRARLKGQLPETAAAADAKAFSHTPAALSQQVRALRACKVREQTARRWSGHLEAAAASGADESTWLLWNLCTMLSSFPRTKESFRMRLRMTRTPVPAT